MTAFDFPDTVYLARCLGACQLEYQASPPFSGNPSPSAEETYDVHLVFEVIAHVDPGDRQSLTPTEYGPSEEHFILQFTPDTAKEIYSTLSVWAQGNLHNMPFRFWPGTLFLVEWIDDEGWTLVDRSDPRVKGVRYSNASRFAAAYPATAQSET